LEESKLKFTVHSTENIYPLHYKNPFFNIVYLEVRKNLMFKYLNTKEKMQTF
jgi:hypothetical protein